jgi:hypothetical protein
MSRAPRMAQEVPSAGEQMKIRKEKKFKAPRR